MTTPKSVDVVYVGESESRTTPDGVYLFPHGEPVTVPGSLASTLLEQDVFELHRPTRRQKKEIT